MKLGKIGSAILNKENLKSFVHYHPGLNVVHVTGKRACLIAKEMQQEGLVDRYESDTESGRIGWKKDGSWKYGVTWQGRVYLHPQDNNL